MVHIFLFLSFLGNPVPIKVAIGDPVLDLPITVLENGAETNLKDVLEDGFAFFLTPNCSYCKAAMANFEPIEDEFNTIFIYVGEADEIRKFIADHKGSTGNAFLVKEEHLVPHGLVTFPAALTYKEGKNRVAMHGPMTSVNLGRLRTLHKRNFMMKDYKKKN